MNEVSVQGRSLYNTKSGDQTGRGLSAELMCIMRVSCPGKSPKSLTFQYSAMFLQHPGNTSIHLVHPIPIPTPLPGALRNQKPNQTLRQHILPIHPRMHLQKQFLRPPPRPPHQLIHAPRVKRQIRRDVIHLPLPSRPRGSVLATVVVRELGGCDALDVRDAGEVGAGARERRPVEGGVAGL